MPLARLKPYSKGEGHLLRRLMVDGQLYVGERGWYKVSDAVAEKLAGMRQPIPVGGKSPLTPPAFDIVDQRGAAEIERVEREAKAQRAGFENPIEVGPGRGDMSTGDLRGVVETSGTVVDDDEVDFESDTGSSPRASRRSARSRKRSR